MGREPKATTPAEIRIVLERGDYFELRTRVRDVEAVEFDALKAAQGFAKQRAEALAARERLFTALAQRHGFDATMTFRWDDATCALIATPLT